MLLLLLSIILPYGYFEHQNEVATLTSPTRISKEAGRMELGFPVDVNLKPAGLCSFAVTQNLVCFVLLATFLLQLYIHFLWPDVSNLNPEGK